MTKFERQILLKARTPGSQEYLCKPCYVQTTGDHSVKASLTGTCYQCKSGPIDVIPWRFHAQHELHNEAGWQ